MVTPAFLERAIARMRKSLRVTRVNGHARARRRRPEADPSKPPSAGYGNAAAPASGSRKRAGNRTANLYVILLSDGVWHRRKFRERNPHYRLARPCVYVGQTSLDPEKRFEQHKNGYKASPIVRKYGIHLVPGLYEHLNPVPSAEREEREERLALDLQRRGYAAWWN